MTHVNALNMPIDHMLSPRAKRALQRLAVVLLALVVLAALIAILIPGLQVADMMVNGIHWDPEVVKTWMNPFCGEIKMGCG